MWAAEALADGLDTPMVRELAGLPRTADARDLRDAFEQALAEAGLAVPDPGLARRHALRRLAVRLAGGETVPAEVASDGWWATESATDAERAFAELLPPCGCCIEYTLGLDQGAWEAELQAAARTLAASAPTEPDC
ncbi:hypothetical protein [Streptomyces sp. cmx-4-9]|uniref:hypothetical protein n=1 Tax=Streptomyces sp. cmx-4-9 TaxID=2790941 RepID=UPI00397FDC83